MPLFDRGRATVRRPASHFRLVAEHFGLATLYLVAGSIGLLWIAPRLVAGDFLSPHVAGVAHLFTLGWLTTTIFGALYQFHPMALGAPLRWPRLGHVSWCALAPGVALFAYGVASQSAIADHVGVALVGVGILLAIVNLAVTLAGAPSHDVTRVAIGVALLFLTTTGVLGAVLLHNLHTGFIAEARVRVLATHLHVALIGWVLIVIVGVSHRMLPMFLFSHGADARWTTRALVLLTAGLPLVAVGLSVPWRPATWFGALCLELGLACFLRQAYGFFRARVRRQPDIGMHFAACALTFLGFAGVLGAYVLVLEPASPRVATTYVLVGLLGGIVLYVVGFFYKIVPLVVWTARYRGVTDRAGVPRIEDMYSARVAKLQLALMPAGVVLLATAILTGQPAGAYAGGALFLGGVLLFASQIVRIAVGKSVADNRQPSPRPFRHDSRIPIMTTEDAGDRRSVAQADGNSASARASGSNGFTSTGTLR